MAAFTDAWLRARCGKPYDGKSEITYRDGLGVRISPKGRITWIYRFLLNGKPVKMKIGEYPSLKIKEAEALKDEKASALASGLDPRVKSLRMIHDDKITLTQLINQWYESYAKSNIKQHKNALRTLEVHVLSSLGAYPVDKLKIRDYMDLLFEIKNTNINTAIRVMRRLKQVLTYAVKLGYIEHNPLIVITAKDFGDVSHVRRTRQNHDDVGAHYMLIDFVPTNSSYQNFLRLVTMFACRSVELRLAKKTDFNLHNMIWTVPEEHNKIRKAGGGEILRAIPSMAVPIIKEQILANDSEYIFPSVLNKSQPVDNKVISLVGRKHGETLSKYGFVDTRNHDVRRTAKNVWERMRFPFRVAEAMLGHKVHLGVQEHYSDYAFIDEQRECYEQWCDYIQKSSKDFLEKNELY
ncbi:integrase arm-type DNA-binding domain-containing protein [Photobacterium damselae subsp. damselae]|uniref:tyrosine-type recombinase/integrase n=1 Tax=Photobacterium damselae TaxID=38293 RepID=UPI00311AF73B